MPDRLSRQTLEKKYNESFQDYAQRWRTVATQVQPPLIEIEITMLFLSTLQEPYYDRLMPMATRSFANMVKVGNPNRGHSSAATLDRNGGHHVVPKYIAGTIL